MKTKKKQKANDIVTTNPVLSKPTLYKIKWLVKSSYYSLISAYSEEEARKLFDNQVVPTRVPDGYFETIPDSLTIEKVMDLPGQDTEESSKKND